METLDDMKEQIKEVDLDVTMQISVVANFFFIFSLTWPLGIPRKMNLPRNFNFGANRFAILFPVFIEQRMFLFGAMLAIIIFSLLLVKTKNKVAKIMGCLFACLQIIICCYMWYSGHNHLGLVNFIILFCLFWIAVCLMICGLIK